MTLPAVTATTAPTCSSSPPAGGEAPAVRTLIDEFLAEQASTTAVERFATRPDEAATPARWYRDLMPATPPAPGQQYAFEVDLDSCSGCKACVVACGSLNGLPEGQSFRSVGTLVGIGDQLPVLRTVTTACHHCVDPGCLSGCPVNAYEKDALTGVVRHLDDQCIGCRYCTLTCPYEVPIYDADRGIVRKCDLCHDRLADGEAPACVQACPTEAIRIRVVDVDAAGDAAHDAWPFPAPDPATTVPTTRWHTSEDLRGGVTAVDADALSLAHAHLPLTVMLVLTQAAVGTLVASVSATPVLGGVATAHMAGAAAIVALATAVVALAASVLHLGRPLQAWRAVLGFGHSWLSREIVAFGLFAAAASAYAAASVGIGGLGVHARPLGWLAAAVGLVGVGTSAMVYAVTGRRWWSLPKVAGRFALTTALTGAGALLAIVVVTGTASGRLVTAPVMTLATVLSVLVGVAVTAEVALLRHRRGPDDDELARTARLLSGQLRDLVVARLLLLGVGGIAAPWLALRMLTVEPTSRLAASVTVLLGLVTVVAAELIERWRFFTAVAPVRMPGRLP